MNSKTILTSSAINLIIIGVAFSFIPAELLGFLKMEKTAEAEILFQLVGALYFGFGMLNWTARRSIVGGIYNKPISIANFAHFLIGALALVKTAFSNQEIHYFIWFLCLIYIFFGICFALMMFKHPLREETC